MPIPLIFSHLSEADVHRLADELAFALQPGDTIALEGDLGAGKTTFARALIRALSAGAVQEVPSPTFTLVQTYETKRFDVAHFDLYRLTDPQELLELGLDPALKRGIAIIEWPSRAENLIPDERITLLFSDADAPDTRTITLTARGPAAERMQRLNVIRNFTQTNGWGTAGTSFAYLQGDASPRRYARLQKSNGARAILMDSPRQPDGPPIRDGKPYSRIAHLAEDVRPFVAIAGALRCSGFSAPEVFAHDMDQGLLLIEDFGDAVFGAEVSRGAAQAALWRRGTDTLLALRQHRPPGPLPLPDGTSYSLPPLDYENLQIEADLLLDWYWPSAFHSPVTESRREAFHRLWHDVFALVLESPKGWLLRDYHSPNLIALADRQAPRDVGIIDFQDALLGPEAYDLVSLLQDARLDVPADLETRLLDHYLARAGAMDANFDVTQFRYAYAALGAQRNTKILGIFARLAKRDGKRQYLAHLPRIWGYLARDLSHPRLDALRSWYDDNFPPVVRSRRLDA